MSNMSNIAIITARGGSKRIPKKNIKEFCGRPIIAYSIEDAFVNKIDRNSLNLITMGMSYSEVTAILGSCGVDAEFGIAAFQYETTDGDVFYISYIENENHELIVAEIYQKE